MIYESEQPTPTHPIDHSEVLQETTLNQIDHHHPTLTNKTSNTRNVIH